MPSIGNDQIVKSPIAIGARVALLLMGLLGRLKPLSRPLTAVSALPQWESQWHRLQSHVIGMYTFRIA